MAPPGQRTSLLFCHGYRLGPLCISALPRYPATPANSRHNIRDVRRRLAKYPRCAPALPAYPAIRRPRTAHFFDIMPRKHRGGRIPGMCADQGAPRQAAPAGYRGCALSGRRNTVRCGGRCRTQRAPSGRGATSPGGMCVAGRRRARERIDPPGQTKRRRGVAGRATRRRAEVDPQPRLALSRGRALLKATPSPSIGPSTGHRRQNPSFGNAWEMRCSRRF